ncbi:MAG: S8 family serine peptidase [Planctomycetota bacterium]
MSKRLISLTVLLSASILSSLALCEWAAASGDLAPLGQKPARTVVVDGQSEQIIEVKFEDQSGIRLRDGQWTGGFAELMVDLNGVVAAFDGRIRRTFSQSEEWLDAYRTSGEQKSGKRLHDLNLFFCVDLPEGGLSGELCDMLNSFAVVELAYPVSLPHDPSLPAVAPAVPMAAAALGMMPVSPDFTNNQGYRGAAPTGVDAVYGNTFSGGKGVGITVIDCETGWTDDHEDLINKAHGNFVGYTPAPYPWNHGTSVLGEIVGEDNGFGVLGLATEPEIKLSTHSPVGGTTNIPGAIMNAAAVAGAGDVIVVEIQCYNGPPAPHPCEYEASTFATIQTATANGVHVIAAAGSGNNNLDSSAYGGAFDLSVRDSGSIIVGASDGASLNKADFSNYGNRLTSHGWGYYVTSSGYGDLYYLPSNPDRTAYTSTFSGTSSATPIVTGAALSVIGTHREAFNFDIDPTALRTLMKDTGTPQGTGGTIGTRPNIRAAVRAMGIPEIAVTGNLIPGGSVTVTSYGTPGDTVGLFWSAGLAPTPFHHGRAGYLFLDMTTMVWLFSNGTIGGAGTHSMTYSIPPNPALSGFVSHCQGYQLFQSGPGWGSLSNVVSWTVQ